MSRLVVLLLAFAASSPWRPPERGRIVVGVQSDPMGSLITGLHVAVRVDGEVVREETIARPRTMGGPFPAPWEASVVSPRADATAKVDVAVEVLGFAGTPPLLTRLSSTRFVPDRTELLRVPLESRCIVFPAPATPTKVPGPLSGPTCKPPETCILGACRSDLVPEEALEPYAADWATNIPDRCKTLDASGPSVVVGTGMTTFLPLASGQTLQAEPGPQGGHHIWIAARMKNLTQRRTSTRIEGRQPETGLVIPPASFVFTFAPAERGSCDIHGLRYQLDNGGIDYKPFLGKPLDVTVTLADPSGATVQATTRIQVAPTLATVK